MSAVKFPFRFLLFVTALCLGAQSWCATAAATEPYRFGVVPQFEQRKLFSIWKPIVDEVSRRAGVGLELVATLSVPEFEKALSKGEFDFVYTNPYHIYLEGPRQGYLPLVRDSAPLCGVLVVKKESPFRALTDLDGKVLAVPSPNAMGASLLLRAELERLHHVHMSLLNVKTHSSVYLHVANGLAEAGGGVEKTLHEQPPEVQGALRILHTTQGFPSHPVAAHPRIPAPVRERVRRALLDMDATPGGHALLAKVPFKQVVTTELHEYGSMRSLDLESFWVKETTAP